MNKLKVMSSGSTNDNMNADYFGFDITDSSCNCNQSSQKCSYYSNEVLHHDETHRSDMALTYNNRAACCCATSTCFHSKLYKTFAEKGQVFNIRKDVKLQELSKQVLEDSISQKSESFSSSSFSSSSSSSSSSASSAEDDDKNKTKI